MASPHQIIGVGLVLSCTDLGLMLFFIRHTGRCVQTIAYSMRILQGYRFAVILPMISSQSIGHTYSSHMHTYVLTDETADVRAD